MQTSGPTPLRSGLIVGTAGAVFALIVDALVGIGTLAPDGGVAIGACVAFLAILALCVEAGNVAAAVSGRVSDGVIAGLIAGAMAGVGLGFISPLTEVMKGHAVRAPMAVVIGAAVSIVVTACTFAGLGAALGALGGLIGQSRHARANRARPASDGPLGE